MAKTPDIGFWKRCGSGTGEGLTPLPNAADYAILATWPDHATARDRVADAAVYRRYRARSVECWTVFLTPATTCGHWSGVAPFTVSAAASGPLAALSRATIRPRLALRFWGRVPDISAMIGSVPNVAFKIGIGEVPLLHQVTFSIWPDAAAMAGFTRTGPHAEAIRTARAGIWFSEELFARFNLVLDSGTWNGTSPPSRLKVAA